MSNTDILKNYEAEYETVMADKAVTNVSGWTEPDNDIPCDEDEYRKRLLKNGVPLCQKLNRPSILSRSPADVIKMLPTIKVLERLKSWHLFYLLEIEPNFKGIHLNLKLLRHAVESSLLDIVRMKNFHEND